MTQQNLKKELFSGTIWSIIDNAARQGITFIVFIALARLLQPEIFGLLSVSIIVVQIFRSVAFDSIATAIVRNSAASDKDYSTGFWMCFLASVPAFLILFFSAPFIEQILNIKGMAEVMRATSFIILTSGIARMHEAWLTFHLKFKSLAIRSSISVIFGGLVGIVMAMKGYGISSLIAQQIVTSLTELSLLWIVTPWRPKFVFSKSSFKEITSYSKHVALTGITNAANQNSDIFFVTYYLGSFSAGLYSTGKRITNTLNFVVSAALMRVSLPAFARLQNDDEQLRSAYLNSSAITAIFTAPIFIGLAVLSKDIILLTVGEKWMGSVVVMQVVTIIGFLTSIGYYNQSIMLVKNKPQWQTRLTLLYAVTNILSFYIFTRYGLLATALAFSLRALLLYPVSAWCAITLIGLNWKKYVADLAPSIISSFIMAAIIIGVQYLSQPLHIILRLSIAILTGAISYFIILYFLSPPHYKNFIVQKVAVLKAKFAS